MANETTTTTATSALPAIINAGIERTASAMRVFRPVISEFPFAGPGKTMDLLTLDAVSAASYTEAATRTFTTGDPTKVTLTPAEIDVAMAFTDKVRRRSIVELVSAYTPEIARAVAVKMDADVAAENSNFSGTAVDGGTVSSWALSEVLAAIGNVREAAKDQVGMVAAVCHTAGWDQLVADSNVISADVRGAGNALFSGVLELVGGTRIYFTTAIESSGSPAEYQNMVFTKRAIALAYKTAFEFDAWDDRDIKSVKIAGGADYDVAMRFAGEGSVLTYDVA